MTMNNNKPQQLRNKLLFKTMAWMALALLLPCLLMMGFQVYSSTQLAKGKLQVLGDSLSETLSHFAAINDELSIQALLESYQQNPSFLQGAIYTSKDVLIYSMESLTNDINESNQWVFTKPIQLPVSEESEQAGIPAVLQGYAKVSLNRDLIRKAQIDSFINGLIALTILSIVVLSSGYFIATRFAKSAGTLSQALMRIGEEKYQEKIDHSEVPIAELRVLATDINKAMKMLENAQLQQAHELTQKTEALKTWARNLIVLKSTVESGYLDNLADSLQALKVLAPPNIKDSLKEVSNDLTTFKRILDSSVEQFSTLIPTADYFNPIKVATTMIDSLKVDTPQEINIVHTSDLDIEGDAVLYAGIISFLFEQATSIAQHSITVEISSLDSTQFSRISVRMIFDRELLTEEKEQHIHQIIRSHEKSLAPDASGNLPLATAIVLANKMKGKVRFDSDEHAAELAFSFTAGSEKVQKITQVKEKIAVLIGSQEEPIISALEKLGFTLQIETELTASNINEDIVFIEGSQLDNQELQQVLLEQSLNKSIIVYNITDESPIDLEALCIYQLPKTTDQFQISQAINQALTAKNLFTDSSIN